MIHRCMLPLGLALVACAESALTPAIDPASIPVDLAVQVVRFTEPRTTVVEGGVGEIAVEGSLVTAQAGYALSGDFVSADAGGYRLIVTAELTGYGITVPIHYRYQANIRQLPPGRYRLDVVYRLGPDDPGHTAFSGTVRVR